MHLLLVACFLAGGAHANADSSLGSGSAQNTATKENTQIQAGAQKDEPQKKAAEPSKSNSSALPNYGDGGTGGASSAAKGAGAQQIIGMGASAASAAYFFSQCGPKNPIACAMGAMSVAQGLSLLGNSKGSKDAATGMSSFDWGGVNTGTVPEGTTSTQTVDGPGYWDPPDGNNGQTDTTSTTGTTPTQTVGTTSVDKFKTQLDGLKNGLAAKGVTLSPDGKTLTMPDGKKMPTSAFGSDVGMSSAGFSDAEINAAKAAIAKANALAANQIKALSMQAEGGGGGGGGAGGGGGGGGYGSGGGGAGGLNMRMPWDKKDEKEKNKLSGMSKKLGNDNIGVAGDNIFDMISNRYKARDAQNNFLK